MNRWVASSRTLSLQRSVAYELRCAWMMRPFWLVMAAKKILTIHFLPNAFLLAVAFPFCLGQANQSDVHVTPRIAHGPKPDGGGPGYKEAEPIKANADLVLVPVTVTDKKDRLVIGLEKDNFSVCDRI
jgi:hypothetical protein